VGARLRREGLRHTGVNLHFHGVNHRIDLADLTDGKAVTVYGQHEVVKDLIAARLAAGGDVRFDVKDVAIHDFKATAPELHFVEQGQSKKLVCDFVAGCDGFHGIARPTVPAGELRFFDRQYPFGWLGILAKAPPACEELVYARHADGFALLSMRSPEISRLYLQCEPDDAIANWPDARIWAELKRRLGGLATEGPMLQKGITAMRSFVTEPMQSGRLFLAGDAAHIVPPTGAKGMNLAIGDVDDVAPAQIRRRNAVRRASAVCGSRISGIFACRTGEFGGELCWLAVRRLALLRWPFCLRLHTPRAQARSRSIGTTTVRRSGGR